MKINVEHDQQVEVEEDLSVPCLSSSSAVPGAASAALLAAGMAMVSAGDGELQSKLKKWKRSADTDRSAKD